MESGRRIFVHVGSPKTGTTYLQSVLWHNRATLRDHGLVQVPDGGSRRGSNQLLNALRKRLPEGAPKPAIVLDRVAEQAARADQPTVFISQEQLAGVRGRAGAAFLRRLASDREVHLVVSTRALARQIPSAWQEQVKTRATISFEDFVTAVVSRAPRGERFWRNHGLVDIIDRWGADLPPERVHVLTVPPPGSPSDTLLHRFGELLDVELPGLPGETRANTSLGSAQAELLRRVNVALGDRVADVRGDYHRVGKSWLAASVLAAQSGPAPKVSVEHEQFCADEANSCIRAVQEAGHHVIGDLEDLRPVPSMFTTQSVGPAADVVDAAAEALATMMDARLGELREREVLRQTIAGQEAELAELRAAVASTTAQPRRWPLLRSTKPR